MVLHVKREQEEVIGVVRWLEHAGGEVLRSRLGSRLAVEQECCSLTFVRDVPCSFPFFFLP